MTYLVVAHDLVCWRVDDPLLGAVDESIPSCVVVVHGSPCAGATDRPLCRHECTCVANQLRFISLGLTTRVFPYLLSYHSLVKYEQWTMHQKGYTHIHINAHVFMNSKYI